MSGDSGERRKRARVWRRFLEVYEPHRGALFRYCVHLTRHPMDAEDLVQDVLARAFVTGAEMLEEVQRPRAWLFRVASNLWIDRVRSARALAVEARDEEVAVEPKRREVREAAGTLLSRLSPQERAAVVLRDVFDMTVDEIAEALTTTPGAIKAALHGGRGKLAVAAAPPRSLRAPSRAVLDAFCAAFDARDLPSLTALLAAGSTVELVGVFTEYGDKSELLRHTLFEPLSSGVAAPHLANVRATPPRAEVREYRGESIVLYWYAHDDGEAVRSVARVETEGDRIVRLREYFFTPDALTDVCSELGVPFRTNN